MTVEEEDPPRLISISNKIAINSSVKIDTTEIYVFRISIGRNLRQPGKKNHRLHKISMMMSESNSSRGGLGYFCSKRTGVHYQ